VSPLSETHKNNKYAERIRMIENADFYPFVLTSQGHLGEGARYIINKIANLHSLDHASLKRRAVLDELHNRLSFALVNANHRMIRCHPYPKTNFRVNADAGQFEFVASRLNELDMFRH